MAKGKRSGKAAFGGKKAAPFKKGGGRAATGKPKSDTRRTKKTPKTKRY